MNTIELIIELRETGKDVLNHYKCEDLKDLCSDYLKQVKKQYLLTVFGKRLLQNLTRYSAMTILLDIMM